MNQEERHSWVFDRTAGRCHICRGPLAFCNYGRHGRRGAWNYEHSLAQSLGGTDHPSNLYAAHIGCNSRKGVRSSRSARREWGHARAPRSRARCEERQEQALILGGVAGLLLARLFGAQPQQAFAWMVVGGAAGHSMWADD